MKISEQKISEALTKHVFNVSDVVTENSVEMATILTSVGVSCLVSVICKFENRELVEEFLRVIKERMLAELDEHGDKDE